MDNPCEKCKGKCCVGIIDVYSTDIIFNDDTMTCKDLDSKYEKVMRIDGNGNCIALKDGKCSIYEKRPQICKDFKVGSPCCIRFQSGWLNAHTCRMCYISEKLKLNKL